MQLVPEATECYACHTPVRTGNSLIGRVILGVGCVVFLILIYHVAIGPWLSRSSGLVELQNIEKRWKDGVKLAESTPRVAASAQVLNLQAIKRDLDSLVVGNCLSEAKDHLEKSMQIEIETMLDFMVEHSIYDDPEPEMKLYETARDKCK